jgi:hypothetical protein
MNTASPASSQPIGFRGWWSATNRPTAAVTRMIVTMPATDHALLRVSVPVMGPTVPMKASSATISTPGVTVIIR